ncbi:hypothetical protein pipiens_016914 [Culex pipiens pipiens]|uniref:FLYWCH-type domain-containing protein n=1 Tax=Culex pipiens pipiens TaxID=38569 RepID=A0ABD1CJ80_CULPP
MYANGYKYWLAYKKGTSGYYRCCRYKTNCPGRCVMDEDGVIRNTTVHNHPPEADRVIVDHFRKVLTQRAASERTDLHVIYLEEATNRHSDASLLYTFSQAESCMRKARRKQHPQEPTSIGELREFLESSELFRIHSGSSRDAFYQSSLEVQDATCVVLWHSRTVEAVGKMDEIYVECSSLNRYHLVVGVSGHRNSCVPVFYAIMTDKTYAGLVAIFSYIREQLGSLVEHALILTDADCLVQNSLETSFSEATVKVYWYHYTEAVLRRMRQLGLGRETTKGHSCSALRMLLVLPLLPANYITPGLEALKKWMQDKQIFSEKFCHLCDFVEQSWIGTVGAKKLSMFGQMQSTSGTAKTFLKELSNQDIAQSNTIWQLLESLTQLATKHFVKLSKRNKRPLNTEQSTKQLKKLQQVQVTVISNATQQWIKTAVHLRNPLQFLQLCSHCINDSLIMESIPGVPATSGSKTKVPSTVEPVQTVQQSQPVSIPANDPPPLAFFPKVTVQRAERAVQISYSRTEPPPLVPISTHKIPP